MIFKEDKIQKERRSNDPLHACIVCVAYKQRTEEEGQNKTFSTVASHVVTHRTTSTARLILTSEIGRDRVFYE